MRHPRRPSEYIALLRVDVRLFKGTGCLVEQDEKDEDVEWVVSDVPDDRKMRFMKEVRRDYHDTEGNIMFKYVNDIEAYKFSMLLKSKGGASCIKITS